ncbi:MAG: hypothetical protein KGH79_03235 [Patescibacteria group bacterium]|nr:hypothetical protein [Patescibacteria group bacterium]
MGKGIFIIGFALLIDGLQAALAWMFISAGAAFQAVTPAGGAVGGATLGCALSSGIAGCIKGAFSGAAAGATASFFGIPLGIGLSFASDVCISLTLGTALIFLLAVNRMYYPGYIWAVFIGEALPGLDILPGWTFLAIRCVLKKNAEMGAGAVGFASSVANFALSPNNPISSIKSATGVIARSSPAVNRIYESEPVQPIAQERQRLVLDVGREITRPSTPPPIAPKPYAQAA